jgi:hypothetical protein
MPAKVTPTMPQMQACGAALAALAAEAGAPPDAGPDCTGACLCTTCPVEALTCLGDPNCKAIVDCAQDKGCMDQTECAKADKCGPVIFAHPTGLLPAVAFGCCGNICQAKCPMPEGGTDGGAKDAPSETTQSDAPAETSTTSDAPSESTTSDAPAEATTSDAPAETGSDAAAATDADNDGG